MNKSGVHGGGGRAAAEVCVCACVRGGWCADSAQPRLITAHLGQRPNGRLGGGPGQTRLLSALVAGNPPAWLTAGSPCGQATGGSPHIIPAPTLPLVLPSGRIRTCWFAKSACCGCNTSAERQIESKVGIIGRRLDPVPLICPTKALIEITGQGAPEILDSWAIVNYRGQRLRREIGARERTDNVSAKIDCCDEREDSGVLTIIVLGEEGGANELEFLIILEMIQDFESNSWSV